MTANNFSFTKGGYTMLSTYQRCQRRFYLRYVKGWELQEKSQKMLWGSLIHWVTARITLLENFCDPWGLDEVFADGLKEVQLSDASLINSALALVKMWISDVLPQDREWRPFVMDQLIGVEIDGFNFLIKPDRILYNPKTNEYKIIEVKCTGYSAPISLKGVQRTRQATAYLWGWNKRFPGRYITTVTPEIFYNRGNVYSVSRSTPIYRTSEQIQRFENTLHSLIAEIRMKALDDDEKWFNEDLGCLEGSNFGCDYEDICSCTYTDVPPGFQLRKHEDEEETKNA